MLRKLVIGSWVIVLCSLFLYSFTQIDLGLTFARASFLQSTLKSFQYVGYFNRPLSAVLFSSIVVLLMALYMWTLFLVWKKKITVRTTALITILASVVLVFSYNAFSYDLFNYVFDAKIVTHYHQNPYFHKALDYPNDPMLGFMHWTHRTYPYGPLWLGISIPLSYIGMGYFLITLYLFKILAAASYLLSGLLIFKIAKKTKLVNPNFALAFFALNPFVLIESLVSAHIDAVMMAVALGGVYMLVSNKKYTGFVLLTLSILIKFATVLLVPLFLWYPFSKHKNKDFIFFLCSTLLMVFGVYLQVAAATKTFQPWYFLLVLPFASLLTNKYYVFIPSVVFSFLVLFQYVPYLYTGNYDPPISQVMIQMLWWSIGISLFPALAMFLVNRTRK